MRLPKTNLGYRKLLGIAAFFAVFCLVSCGRGGQSQLKIIGGQPVTEGDPLVKHLAALVNAEAYLQCTVTAVAPDLFITAAHCVHGRDIKGWTIQSGIEAGTQEVLQVDSASVHKQFSASILYSSLTPDLPPNDIALIKTTEPSRLLTPMPIAQKKSSLQDITNKKILLAGYGRTDGADDTSLGTLQKVKLVVSRINAPAKEFLTENDDGKMGCHGDSGAPAMMQQGKTLFIVGTISRGGNSCTSGSTVFTDLSAFDDFLGVISPK